MADIRELRTGAKPALSRQRFVGLALLALTSALIAHAIFNWWVHASDLILEMHSFRQTQTAISTYWLLRDGFRFAYSTPILGAPWSVPFEFPLFQILTAYVVRVTALDVDSAGRAVSFAFFLLTLWPIRLLGRWLRLPRHFFTFAASLYCASPLYLFWGRTFMIESLALFLTLLFLALTVRALRPDQTPSPRSLLALSSAVTLALLVKVTTAAVPFMLVLVLVAVGLFRRWRSEARPIVSTVVGAPEFGVLVALTVGFTCLFVWTRFSDSVKATSALTAPLRSGGLRGWTFGTASQRFSSELWVDTVLGRAIPEAIGAGILVVAGALLLARLDSRQRLALIGAIALFLGPFIVFPKLHVIHNYYQYSNSLFLLLGAAVVLAALSQRRPVWTLGILLLVTGLQIHEFHPSYRVVQGTVGDTRVLQLSEELQKRTDRGTAFLGFGLGFSSDVPYYSERRAVLVPGIPKWDGLAGKVAADPGQFLGGIPLGAVVICPEFQRTMAFQAAIAELSEGARREIVAGCEIISNLPTYH